MSKLVENEKTFAEIYELCESQYEEVDLASLPVSVRIYNRLMGNGINTVGKLLNSTPKKVFALKGFGNGSREELDICLKLLKENHISNNIAVFKNYAELIAVGDFSFADTIALSAEEAELLAQYQRTFEILGEEFAFDCIVSPEKIIPIIKMLISYINEMERKIQLRELADMIPAKRKSRKAYGYINAFTLDEPKRRILKELCLSTTDSIESMLNSGLVKEDIYYSALAKFLEWCTFDLQDEIKKLFNDLYESERNRQVIIKRAQKYTLEQTGLELNITRERVRQIEKKVKLKFARLHGKVRIISKISAERNGDTVLTPLEIEDYCGEYTQELLYLLQSYKSKNYFYDQQFDVFVIGDDSIHEQVEDYIETLPDMIKPDEIEEVFAEAEMTLGVSSEMIEKAFFDAYELTGNIYHRHRLSLSAIYENILKCNFEKGLKIYDADEIKHFRQLVFEEYGDVGIPQNDRALIARIIPSCILCGRGIYKLKQNNYISKELASKIYNYISKSENPVFLTNTLFSVFKNELLGFGVDNKYYLQGILRELYGDEFFFKRDYISKDANITSIYSSIVEYIKKSPFTVSKEEIQRAFPGITEVVLNFAIGDLNILNYFSEYIHSNKLNISVEEKNWLFSLIEEMLSDNKPHHIKELYVKINISGSDILTRNAAMSSFSAYSLVEYLFCNDFKFSRPYIAPNGVEIERPNERLHSIISNSKEFSVNQISKYFKENHFQVQSILEFINSCNDEFLLIDNDRMMRIEDIGVTKEVIRYVEQLILKEITSTVSVSELSIYHKLPKLSVPWTEWLLYSALNKWGEQLTVGTSSNQFRASVPLISPKGLFDASGYKNYDKQAKSMVQIDDLDDIDSLLDVIIDEEWM